MLSGNPEAAGIGLRAPHYRDLQALADDAWRPAFLEVHSENFFGDGGQPWAWLNWFRARYPVSVHGVGMSLGSGDRLNADHVVRLQRVVERVEPMLVSEHLCWVGVNGRYLNDLLPLPYTEESLDHVVRQVDQLQTALKRRILIENVSSYLEFHASTIPEWEFVAELSRRAGCGVLLDVNNIHVNSRNHGFDPLVYLDAMPADAIGEIHLAGFQDTGEILIDTHGNKVSPEVWELYRRLIQRIGPVPTLIEWDTDIPALPVLMAEAMSARDIMVAAR